VTRFEIWTLVLACSIAGVAAQQPRPTFEVAFVRPQARPTTVAEAIGWPRAYPGGRLAGTHATLEWLITFAYDVKAFQVIGGPDWIRREYFALDAKAGADVPLDQLRLMLRSLLEERFKLATHTEQRDMRYLALVLACTDGRPGRRLHRLGAGACDGKTVAEVFRETFPDAPARNRIAGACVDLRDLAQLVTLQLDTLVIDKTGLTGQWVFEAPYEGQPPRLGSSRLGAPVETGPGSDPGLSPYTPSHSRSSSG
jgi:uncharacterized protein (TIGR03435 family)